MTTLVRWHENHESGWCMDFKNKQSCIGLDALKGF